MNGQTALRARFLQTEREFHQSRSVTNHGQGSKQVTALSIPTAWQPVAVVRASLPPSEPTANVESLPTEPQQQGDAPEACKVQRKQTVLGCLSIFHDRGCHRLGAAAGESCLKERVQETENVFQSFPNPLVLSENNNPLKKAESFLLVPSMT